MLFTEAKTDRTAGHEWRETGKNLKDSNDLKCIYLVRVRIEILYEAWEAESVHGAPVHWWGSRCCFWFWPAPSHYDPWEGP